MRARWLPLYVGGKWNPELRRHFDTSSGCYAFRRKGARAVEYVGESHTGRGWKTLQRHFQDHSGAFKDRSEYVRSDPHVYECAVFVTSTGARAKTNGDQKALDLQARLIDRYKPTENRDDGKAYGTCPHHTSSWRCARAHNRPEESATPSGGAGGDEDFPFGANVNPKRGASMKNPKGEDALIAQATAIAGDKVKLHPVGKKWIAVATNERGAEEAGKVERTRAAALRSLIAVLEDAVRLAADRGARRAARGNPTKRAAPVVLGELVSIVYRSGRAKHRKAFAPGRVVVAYVPSTSRLVLVFAPHVTGASSSKSRREYRKTHWGRGGDGERLTGDVLEGAAPSLGTVLEITYATRKGLDSELVDYWHTFGDYGAGTVKKSFVPPTLDGATVGGRQLLRLVGGSYTVTAHGIVG